jgi:hypothetical protein
VGLYYILGFHHSLKTVKYLDYTSVVNPYKLMFMGWDFDFEKNRLIPFTNPH